MSDDDLDDKPASFSISEKESTRPLYHLEDIEDIDLSHIETNQSIDDSLYNEKDSFHCFYVIFIISIHFRIHFYWMVISQLSWILLICSHVVQKWNH